MKQIYTILFLLLTITVSAQIPSGYYDSATGSGFTLKTQLHNIINNHNDQGYSAMDGFIANYDLDLYYDAGDSNTILDVYSEDPLAADPYNFTPVANECGEYSSEGDCYNKEHVIPKSVFNDQTPMYSDAHELLPTDGRVNGFRSNYPIGLVNDTQLVSQSGITNPTRNGSKLGNNLNSGYSAGYSGIVFEPIDEFKGDIARIYFYFVTRYENQVSAWSSYAMFNGTADQALDNTFLSILMTWHNMDPVSQKEIDRNNNIYYNYQNNRNPFVDHPEYVNLIWNTNPDTEAPTEPTNLIAANPTDNTIDLSWTAASDNVSVASYDVYIDNVFSFNTGNTSTIATVTGLTPDTNYCFTLKAVDTTGNPSEFSNQACETTTNMGTVGGGSDLYFSEYIEGSSFNKVIEIANFTGTTITDLSIYTLKLAANGNGTWGTTYTFPSGASIANQDVYVIANGGSTVCETEYDDLNTDITSFNGNDSIGLFKNDVLIDIIGDINDSAEFGKDVTLVRKPEYTEPSTTFDITHWDSFAQNECSNLGSHTQDLSVDDYVFNTVKMYPNPTNGNTVTIISQENLTVEVYNILGKKVKAQTITSSQNKLNISGLSRGVYLVKLNSATSTTTKKLIKQ